MMWASVIGLVALMAVACGQQAAQVDVPVWDEDDARAGVRDYIVSIEANSSTAIFSRANAILDMREWEVEYSGEGWWIVSTSRLGRLLVEVTPTLIPDRIQALYAECNVPLAPTPTPAPARVGVVGSCWVATLIVEKVLEPIMEYQNLTGAWRVSERTDSVVPGDEAAATYLAWLLNN